MTEDTGAGSEGEVETVDPVWIEMDDGCCLAAKLWLPKGARAAPVPGVLEYIPYRRRDNKAERDQQIHAHFAAHGYASLRVDMRGSGDSGGILEDEYLPREMLDGLAILRWMAAQDWCTGRIGLFGLSWGGFNGLQIAALRPPELGAVITVCASDDRYADDVHYMGGCLLTDNLSWAGNMFAFNSCPPDPMVVGEDWRRIWMQRLEHGDLWLRTWLAHPHRDAYWKQGSVNENYSAIRVPVMAVSGWRDGYTNPVFRLMENLDVPRRAILGPWGHRYPHTGGPGPAIDFLGECLMWWDRWLAGVENGVEAEPRLRAWMMDPSSPLNPNSPGRWVAEDDWPSPRIEERAFHLGHGALSESPAPGEGEMLNIRSPLGVGLFAGKWCSYAEQTDLPWDQRQEDGGALLFDSAPLETPLEILGAPRAVLELSADEPVAMVAVRLCDVAPSDRSTRVSFAVLNLTHRDSHEHPAPLEPGRRYRVEVTLNNIAQRFEAGHRIRLAVSSSYWPLAWPSPRPARLSLATRPSRLILPVRPPRGEDDALRAFGPPRMAPAPATRMLAPAERRWAVNFDLASNHVRLDVINNEARVVFEDHGLETLRNARETYSYTGNDVATLRGDVEQEREFRRAGWSARTVTRTTLTATEEVFQIRATLDAYEGDARIFARSWDEEVPRKLV